MPSESGDHGICDILESILNIVKRFRTFLSNISCNMWLKFSQFGDGRAGGICWVELECKQL